jgi:hypothetical protein
MRFQAAVVAVAGGVMCLHAFKPALILENLVDIDNLAVIDRAMSKLRG